MKLCIITHEVVIGEGQGRINYEVAWEAARREYQLSSCTKLITRQSG
jgi:hypothetical protein